MFKFEDLRVYQESIKLTESVYTLTNKWPRDEIFGLTNQLRRAVVSIALNIAEGSSRTKKDFRHFLDLSRGSCYESVAILSIAKTRGYISNSEYISHYDWCERIAKMTNALKTSLR